MSTSATLKNQEETLAVLASSMSTALIANDHGKLTAHEGCRKTSETSFRKIQLSPTLAPSQSFCAVPSFSLIKRGHRAPRSTKAAVEQAAASSLAEPLKASPNDFHLLPARLVHNVAESFMSLVDSRFRSYLTVLAHQSRKDPNTFAPLLKIFSAMSRPVAISTIVNTFRVMEHSTNAIQKDRIVSSLVLETVIDLDILGDSLTVVVSGAGVMHGVFDSPSSSSPENNKSLSSATILINMNNLLQSMVAQARHVVKIAKDKMSQLYLLSLSSSPSPPPQQQQQQTAQTKLQVPLHNLNPDLSLASHGVGALTRNNDNNNMHAMSPPPRRVSVNSAPRLDIICEEESSSSSLTNKTSSRKRGDNDNTTPTKREEIPKSSGLDLLTQAAKCLRVPSSDRIMPGGGSDSQKQQQHDNAVANEEWKGLQDVTEV